MHYLGSISLKVCIANGLVLESLSSQASYHIVWGVLAFAGCNSRVDMLMSENAKSSICILRYDSALSVMKCSWPKE